MAILRAGPWATPTDSFVDEPDNFDTLPDQSPVNCALNDWTGVTWKALFIKEAIDDEVEVELIEAGTAALGEDVEFDCSAFDSPDLILSFYYQATVEFDMDFNWIAEGIAPDEEMEWEWSYTTIEGESGGDAGLVFDPCPRRHHSATPSIGTT